jgi:hypothetical protein
VNEKSLQPELAACSALHREEKICSDVSAMERVAGNAQLPAP